MSDIDVDPNIDPSNFIRRQQQASMSYALGSLEDDPEKATRAAQLGDVTGDNPALILPNLENYEQQHKAALTAQLLKSNKFLRQYIDADAIHAKISNDDYGNLDQVSERLKQMSLPERVFRAPEAISAGIFGGAVEGFKRGWSNIANPEHVADEELRKYPLFTALMQSARFPVDVGAAALGGAVEAIHQGTKLGYQSLTGDQTGAENFSRDIGGMAEAVLTGTSGYHGIHVPEAQLAKLHGIVDKAKPWLDDNREPPKGLDPEIDKLKLEQSKLDLDNLDEAFKAAQGSATRERNPDIFASFIRQHTDASIGISGDAVARLYGDKVPEPGDGILGWSPGIAEELATARATGGDVRIPLADWLAKADPEVAKELKDDIRVRPGGITKNEVVAEREAKEGLAEPPKPAEIIPEPLPSVRGSAGLEPLYSVGDRKLELKKLPREEGAFAVPGTEFHDFQLLDENGKAVGALNLSTTDGKSLYVDSIEGIKGYSPNAFGPHLIRDLLRQLKEQFPEAEEIKGHRVSGAREAAGKEMTMPTASVKFDDALDWSHLVDLRSILSETKVDVGKAGVLHYSREFSPHEAAADALVRDTLGRIAPNAKVFTPSAISVPERPDIRRSGFMAPFKDQNPWIVVALDRDAPEGVARHESIHYLRQFGFFSEDEWFNLVRAAKENDWAKKFGIDERYKDLPESAKLEEAIAEGYRNWADGADAPKYAHPIFEKIKALLTQLREGMAKLLGRDVSWQEVFEKIESGEVGAREPRGHEGEAFLEPSAMDAKVPETKDLKELDKHDYNLPLELTRALDKWVGGPADSIAKGHDIGIFHAGDIEDAISGKNDKLMQQLEEAGEPIRQALRAKYGDIINLYRVQTKVPEGSKTRSVLSMTSNRAFAEDYAGARKEQKLYTEEDIRAKEKEFAETGKTTFEDKQYLKKEQDYIAIMDPSIGGFVTDTGSVREYMQDRNEMRAEDNTRREKALSKIQAFKVPVNDVVWYTNRFNQNEFLVRMDRGLEPSASDEPAFGKGAVTTVERQKLYDDLIAKRHTEDLAAAMKRSEAEQRKTQTKEWKENEKSVRSEVDESIRNRPDVAADLFFGAGELYGTKVSKKVKLGSDFLTDEQKARLPKDYVAKDGVNPDDFAGLFGYQSGDTLVNHLGDYNEQKLAANMSAKDFVKRAADIETDRQMQLRYGQLEQSILDHATEQAQSETQLNLLHEETYRLATEAGLQYTITKEQLRSSVGEQFDGMQVKSLDPERFRASMEKSNKAIEMALLKEKPTEAYQAAQQKELAFIMWKEASALEKAKDKLDKTAKVMRKSLVPSIDSEYLNHIHNLLQRAGYQIGRTPEHIAENIASKASTNIAEFANEKLKESAGYRDIPVADALNDPNFAKSVEDMTTFEFYGFKQTIDALVKQGRDEQKFIRQGEAYDLKEVIGQMVDQIKTFPLKTYKATKGGWAKATDLPRSFMAGLTNMETIFNRFDRDDPRGIFNRYIVYSLFKMSNGENAMLREFSKPYRELGFDKADMSKLVDAPFADPLNRDAGPWNGFTHGNVLAILQNAGNKSNLRVMAKGYGMEPEALMSWLEANTTREDWVRAQKLGGIFKDLIKHADGVYERINGITVQKIPLEPISNIHGEFDGWYHPLIKDPIRRGNIPERIGVYNDSDFGHITTANGYTKKRSGAIYPLDITFDSVTNRMTQMIHDINFREGVLELQKVFKNPKFLDSITAHYGEHYSDLMKPYLESIAGSASVPSKAMAKATQWSEYIRQNVISTYIGFNPSTALKHGPTAWAFSARQVGLIPFLNAFYKTAAEAIGFKDAVKGLYGQSSELGIRNSEFAMKWSEELQRRERHWQDTFAGANKLLEGASTVREQMIQYASWLVAKSDMLSAKPTWIAAYEKATQEGSNHGEAIDIADSKVRKAHGSTAQVNQPALVRGGGPLHSWLTSIYGFFGTDMQRKIETAHAINDMYQLGKEGEIKSAAKMAPGIVADIMTYAIWTVIVEEIVSSQYTDDKRSGLTRLAGFGSTALSNSVLYLRDLAYAFNTGHDPGVGLVSSPLHDMSNVVRDIKRGSGSFSKQRAGKTLENILTLTGDGTGIAPRTIDHALRFGVDLVNRQAHPKTAGDWWRGVTHGTTEKRIER